MSEKEDKYNFIQVALPWSSTRAKSRLQPPAADLEEAGPFKNYSLEFQLVYISSASMMTGAMLSGSGDVATSVRKC